jgi:hypothetical protein
LVGRLVDLVGLGSQFDSNIIHKERDSPVKKQKIKQEMPELEEISSKTSWEAVETAISDEYSAKIRELERKMAVEEEISKGQFKNYVSKLNAESKDISTEMVQLSKNYEQFLHKLKIQLEEDLKDLEKQQMEDTQRTHMLWISLQYKDFKSLRQDLEQKTLDLEEKERILKKELEEVKGKQAEISLQYHSFDRLAKLNM